MSMKKTFRVNQIQDNLANLGFYHDSFSDFIPLSIEKFLMASQSETNIQIKFQKACQILVSHQNKGPNFCIKFLVFIHIYINLVGKHVAKQKIFENSVTCVAKILQIQTAQMQLEQQKIEQQRSFSLESTVKWIKSKLNKSMEKRKQDNKSIARNRPSSPIKINSKKQIEMKSISQVLAQKIILPYGAYLLKLINYKEMDFTKEKGDMQPIWKVINLLKYLLKVVSQFPLILRYYKKEMFKLIQLFVKIFDSEIKRMYPKIAAFVSAKYLPIKEKAIQIYEKNEKGEQKIQMLQKLAKSSGLVSLKEMLDEISSINEDILILYLSQHTNPLIQQNCIYKPQLIKANHEFQLVYFILADLSKSERKKSKSKNKVGNNSEGDQSKVAIDCEQHNGSKINWRSSIKHIGSELVENFLNINHRQARVGQGKKTQSSRICKGKIQNQVLGGF